MSFLNNGFMSFLGKIADMFILSVLWLMGCIPIITIVPATIALYYATVKVIRRDAGYVFRDFWKGFKQNVRQGMILEIVYAGIGGLLYLVHRFSLFMGLNSSLGKVYYIFSALMLLVLACIFVYIVPVISRFTLSLFSAARLAVAFSISNLKTLIPLMFTAIAAAVVAYLFPPSVFIIPSAYCFLLSFSVEKVLCGYIKTNLPNAAEHSGMWYMEE